MKLNKFYIYMLSVAPMYAQAKDQDMSGIQIGGGINVTFDKNEFFDVQVANQVKQVNTSIQKTSDKAVDASDLVKTMWGYNETKSVDESIKCGDITIPSDGSNSITVDLSKEGNDANPAVYYTASKNARMNKVGVGAEIKLAYFHDFNNGIMVGIDTSCVFSPKNKKSVKPGYMNPHPDLELKNGDDVNVLFTWNGEKYRGDQEAELNDGEQVFVYPTNLDKDGFKDEGKVYDTLKGGHIFSYASFDEKHDKYGEITVENRVCSPRAALVVGMASDGIFAGIRGGVLYEKLKVSVNGYWYSAGASSENLKTQETKSRVMSITAPFVGLQFIKQVHVGSNDAQFYFTADRQIGNDEKDVNIYGVKKLQRNRYNLSAGVTWKVKF